MLLFKSAIATTENLLKFLAFKEEMADNSGSRVRLLEYTHLWVAIEIGLGKGTRVTAAIVLRKLVFHSLE